MGERWTSAKVTPGKPEWHVTSESEKLGHNFPNTSEENNRFVPLLCLQLLKQQIYTLTCCNCKLVDDLMLPYFSSQTKSVCEDSA